MSLIIIFAGLNKQAYKSMYSFPVENWDKESKQDAVSKTNASLASGRTPSVSKSVRIWFIISFPH